MLKPDFELKDLPLPSIIKTDETLVAKLITEQNIQFPPVEKSILRNYTNEQFLDLEIPGGDFSININNIENFKNCIFSENFNQIPTNFEFNNLLQEDSSFCVCIDTLHTAFLIADLVDKVGDLIVILSSCF